MAGILIIQRPEDPEVFDIFDQNGVIVDCWHDNAHCDYPEDLTINRMIGDLYHKVFEAGVKYGRENPAPQLTTISTEGE